MKKFMLLMVMVLLLSGCKEEIKDEPVIETDPNTDSLVDFELSDEVYSYLENKEINYVGDDEGYIFISYTLNELEEEMICINPNQEIEFTITGGYEFLRDVVKYDTQFLIQYRLLDESGGYGVFDLNGDLLFSFDNTYYMQRSDLIGAPTIGVAYIGNDEFVYIEKEDDQFTDQTMKLIKQDKNDKTVLFEFYAHEFRMFAGYIENDSFIIYYGSEFISVKIARIDLDGNVLYDEFTVPGWVRFVGDRIVVERGGSFIVYDLNLNITASFYLSRLYNVKDYDGYIVLASDEKECTVNDDGSYLCVFLEPEIIEEVLYTFDDGSTLVKSMDRDQLIKIEIIEGEERTLLKSHDKIRNVIVENDLIYISLNDYTKYYLEVFDFEGNVVTEEDEFPGVLFALKDDGNYLVNYCEQDPQSPFITDDRYCIKEVDSEGNIIWELEEFSQDAVVEEFSDNLVIISSPLCNLYIGRHDECELLIISFDGETRFDVNDDYKDVTYLYQDDDYIYISAIVSNGVGGYDKDGVVFKLDSSLNIVNEFEIAYATYETIYYIDEDSLVRHTMQKPLLN